MKWWTVLLLLAFAGCTGSDPPGGADGGDDGDGGDGADGTDGDALPPLPGDYLLVWIDGNETRELQSGVAGVEENCQVAFDHKPYPDEVKLTYLASKYTFDRGAVETIMAFRHYQEWDRCDGVFVYTMRVDEADVDQQMADEYGRLRLQIQGDTVQVEAGEPDAASLQAGQETTITYSYTYSDDTATWDVTGRFFVKNMGQWPRDRLTPL